MIVKKHILSLKNLFCGNASFLPSWSRQQNVEGKKALGPRKRRGCIASIAAKQRQNWRFRMKTALLFDSYWSVFYLIFSDDARPFSCGLLCFWQECSFNHPPTPLFSKASRRMWCTAGATSAGTSTRRSTRTLSGKGAHLKSQCQEEYMNLVG